MNQNDINRAFTEKVAELLSRGYQIHPGTMGGSQGEIAHVDLYKDDEIIRVLLDRSAGNDDNLHLWVKQFSLKDHISELTEQQADFIIRRLEEYRSQVAPKPELITEEQQNMCFKQMYRIAEISPSDIKPRERMRGVISKVTGREIRPDRDIFSRVTRAEGSEIIEMLKRILRSEQNKLKRSDKHGTCNAGKEEPP